MALYGLGAILEDANIDVRLAWTADSDPYPQVTSFEADEEAIGQAVRDHAARLAADGSWLSEDVTLDGQPRGLMSPRLTQFRDRETWLRVQQGRHRVLDELTASRKWLDLRLIAALGEPAYWSFGRKGEVLQDDGASRLEMQPRNQGSEIVGSRLRKLADAVAARSVSHIVEGLCGLAVRDEVGNNKPDSRTATGFASPGPTDNAVAWCALWGISQMPIAMRIGTAVTTGHIGRPRDEWFYAPVWHQQWRPARVRSILASAQLRTAAAAGLPLQNNRVTDIDVAAARAWLSARHVLGLVRFPIARFGSDNAPERRAMRGQAVPTEARAHV